MLATHLLSSTAVCFVEVLGAQDWPREVVNKNLPGYVGFGTVGMFPVSQSLTKRKARWLILLQWWFCGLICSCA